MNIVVSSSPWIKTDIPTLFEDEEITFVDDIEMSMLLRDLGIYPSASKARHAGRSGPIPTGWTEFKASKKIKLWIWNPTE